MSKSERAAGLAVEKAVSVNQKKAEAALEAQKKIWADDLNRERHEKEARLASLKSREETLCAELSRLEEDSNKKEQLLREKNRTHEALLTEALENQKKQLIASLEDTWIQQVKDLEDRCARLLQEVKDSDQRKNLRIAEEKELCRQQIVQQLDLLRRETSSELASKSQAFEQQKAIAERYWEETQKLNQEIKSLYAKHSQDLKEAEERHRQDTKQIQAEKEQLTKDFVSKFRGSTTAAGQIGENFCAMIHAELCLGSWTDTSKMQCAGQSDALWELEFPNNCPKMSCMVEIKNSQSLHSQNDLQKFCSDVSEAARQGRVNCALMISLATRIQGTKQLHLSFVHGLPCLKASRSADDAIPAGVLVELALNTMANIWPLVQQHRRGGSDIESIFVSISDLFENQLGEINRLSKEIESLDRTGRGLQKTASQLRRIRDNLAKGIDVVRVQFPQLMDVEVAESVAAPQQSILSLLTNDVWSSPEALALIDAIHQFKTEHHGHYCKTFDELKLPRELSNFVENNKLELKLAVDRAKKLKSRPPAKRARVGDEEDSH